jgi:hypothetical protein
MPLFNTRLRRNVSTGYCEITLQLQSHRCSHFYAVWRANLKGSVAGTWSVPGTLTGHPPPSIDRRSRTLAARKSAFREIVFHLVDSQEDIGAAEGRFLLKCINLSIREGGNAFGGDAGGRIEFSAVRSTVTFAIPIQSCLRKVSKNDTLRL